MELKSGQSISVARVELACSTCATRFTVDHELIHALRFRGERPRCPQGHETATGSTIVDNLREEIDRERRQVKWHAEHIKRLEHEAMCQRMRILSLKRVVKQLRAARESLQPMIDRLAGEIAHA